MYCTDCGKQIPEGEAFCADCGAPSASPLGLKRTGLIVAVSVVATMIVAAGIGVGLWLGLRGEGDAATVADTGAGTTTVASEGFVSTGYDDGSTQDPDEVSSSDDQFIDYLNTTTQLLEEMDSDDIRLPELADIINANVPDTPTNVHDELVAMAVSLNAILGDLNNLPIPSGYEDSDYWVKLAAAHMLGRVQATIDGIEAMWDTGAAVSGTPFFDTGRTERDAYMEAIGFYYLGSGGT